MGDVMQARLAQAMPPVYQLPYVNIGVKDEKFKENKLMMPQQLFELKEAERRQICSYMSDIQ